MVATTAPRRLRGCSYRSENDALTAHDTHARTLHLADVRRGAGLSDVHVDVSVAHTRSRLNARFFVEMARVDGVSGAVTAKWGFGLSMTEVKAFETRLLRVIKRRCDARERGGDAIVVKKTRPSA